MAILPALLLLVATSATAAPAPPTPPAADVPAGGPAAVQLPGDANGPRLVLPPDAAAVVRALLDPETPLTAGGPALSAEIDRDRVLVTVGPADAPALRVTLMRPAAAPEGAERVGGAALVLAPGPAPPPLVAALVARMRASGAALVWREVAAAAAPAGPSGPTAPAEDVAGLRRQLRAVEDLLRGGDAASALRHLAALPAADVAAEPLPIAHLWRRAGDTAASERVLASLGPAAALDATTAAEVAALRGDDGAADAVVEANLPARACDLVGVARRYGDLGRPQRARDVAERLRRADPACADAWELSLLLTSEGGGTDAGGALAREALARFPGDARIRLAAATADHARGDFAAAVPLLEAVARERLGQRGALRSLLAAVMRDVPHRAEYQQRYAARLEAAPDDVLAQFMLGVLHHYGSEFERSNALLAPLEAQLDQEDRLHIYRAMNDFNLGLVAPALARLDRIAERPDPDPDTFYCRAEILRDSDRAEAQRNLARYAAISQGNPLSNPDKEQRIRGLLQLLDECLADHRAECEGAWEHPRLRHRNRWPWAPWAVGGAAALAALALSRALARRRTRR